MHQLRRNRLLVFLLIQIVALLVVRVAAAMVPSLGPAHVAGVLVQAATAGALSAALRQERWCWAWHAIVAILLWVARDVDLPASAYPAAFMLLLLLYGGVIYGRVPYFPSGPVTWAAVAGLIRHDRAVRFLDIGCGLGGMCRYIGRNCPRAQVTGVEISPPLWLFCRVRELLSRTSARYLLADYTRLDLSSYDVVFAYLSPAAMPQLWEQVQRQMGSGAMLVSFEFPIPGVEPHRVIPAGRGGQPLYCYSPHCANPAGGH